MAEKSKIAAETDAYLAKIRKTVSDSKNLVESAKLRMAETDRMLEDSGTTREEVMKFSFTAAQKEAVNAQLERMGFEKLDDDGDIRGEYGERSLGSGAETTPPTIPSPTTATSTPRRSRRSSTAATPPPPIRASPTASRAGTASA
jgi:hypothetical protein